LADAPESSDVFRGKNIIKNALLILISAKRKAATFGPAATPPGARPGRFAAYNARPDPDEETMSDFIGNLVLALLLVLLLRVLYAVCAMLVRTRDGGNIAFAIALPAGLLYIVVRNPVPVSSWAGLASGALLGAALLLSISRWQRRRP
jgi:hypothetical protein